MNNKFEQLVVINFASGTNTLLFDPIHQLRNVSQLKVVGLFVRTPTLTATVPPMLRVEMTIGGGHGIIPAVTNSGTGDNALLLPMATTAAGWNYTDYNTPFDVLHGLVEPIHNIDRINLSLSQFDGSTIAHLGAAILMRATIDPHGPPRHPDPAENVRVRRFM